MAENKEQSAFVVFELYHNPNEYSSMEGRLPLVRSVCSTLEDAAEIVAKMKIDKLQSILDAYRTGQQMQPLTYNTIVAKVLMGTIVDPMNLTRIPVTEANLSPEIKDKLNASVNLYNETVRPSSNAPLLSGNQLRVDPSSYQKDRSAREWEMMHKMNVQPLWTKRVNPIVSPSVTRGKIPQPASEVTIRQAHGTTIPNESRLAPLNPPSSNVAPGPTPAPGGGRAPLVDTFAAGVTPTVSAPPAEPGRLPVASEHPNPVTTSVPLAPVTAGSSINNPIVTDSLGSTHPMPPVNTATSPNSRVTS